MAHAVCDGVDEVVMVVVAVVIVIVVMRLTLVAATAVIVNIICRGMNNTRLSSTCCTKAMISLTTAC